MYISCDDKSVLIQSVASAFETEIRMPLRETTSILPSTEYCRMGEIEIGDPVRYIAKIVINPNKKQNGIKSIESAPALKTLNIRLPLGRRRSAGLLFAFFIDLSCAVFLYLLRPRVHVRH